MVARRIRIGDTEVSVINITTAQPNNNTSWSRTNAASPTSTTRTAPDSSGTASEVDGDLGAVFYQTYINTTQNPLVGLQQYKITGYAKSTAGGTWLLPVIYDGGSVQFAQYIDLVGQVAGSTSNTGGGVVDAISVTDAGGGWTKIEMTGHFPSNSAGTPSLNLQWASANGVTAGSGGAHNTYYFWGWGA